MADFSASFKSSSRLETAKVLQSSAKLEASTQSLANPLAFQPPILLLALFVACTPAPTNTGSDSAPLKRLSAAQFQNTVDDLLPSLELPRFHFPAELSIGGFDNNTAVNTVTASYVEASHSAAVAIAGQVADNAQQVLGCDPEAVDACTLPWLEDFASRAWRRPLSSQDWTPIAQAFQTWESESDALTALQLGLQMLLESPDFLYLLEFGDPDKDSTTDRELTAWELAARLSTFLWASTPDAGLRSAAEGNQLLEEEILEQQVLRMLQDPKAKRGLKDFSRQWLELDAIGSNALDLSLYFPTIEDEEEASDFLHQVLQPAMRLQSEIFVDQIVFHGTGTLAELLTSATTWTTPELADLSGAEIDNEIAPIPWYTPVYTEGEDQVFSERFFTATWDPKQRLGLLGLPGFLHTKAKPVYPSPILRGVFVLDRLLCQPPGAPLEDMPTPEEDTGLIQTNRDRYAAHTSNSACAACHDRIDGVGFSFENFDALGQWRNLDNGQVVDATGELIGTDRDGPLENAVDLAETLAQSRTVHDCLSTQFFRYAFARTETNADVAALDYYQEGFWEYGGDIPELMFNIATSRAFRTLEGQP